MEDERTDLAVVEENLQPEKRYYEGYISLGQAEAFINGNLVTTARCYVATGYYLKRIRDDRLYEEAGYQNFEDYVRERYGKDKGWASKCIKVNQQLSVDGNSPLLDGQYREYSTYQLVELAYMTEEQRELASPDQTVKQLHEIRKPEKVVTSQPEEPVEEQIPGQMDITDFPGFIPENPDAHLPDPDTEEPEVVYQMSVSEMISAEDAEIPAAEPGQDAAEKQQTGTCAHRDGFPCSLDDSAKQKAGTGEDCTHSCCWECVNHGACNIECYASANRPELQKTQQDPEICCENAAGQETKELLSAYGTPKKAYPEGSMIATEACEGGHTCFSCAMECQIRVESRYCMEAPMGNPFPCETMNTLELLREEIGDKCQFVNHDIAFHRAGDNEPSPCCKNCEEPCGYICRRAKKGIQDRQEGKNEGDGQKAIDGKYHEIEPDNPYTTQYFLSLEQKKLNDLLEAFKDTNPEDIPQKLFMHQKTIVAALAGMVCDLENEELKKQMEEEKSQQPELPILKNNDQRAAFVDDYDAWPIWIETKETGERYYRYDLPDASMVVKVYFHKCYDYKSEARKWEDRFRDAWGDQEYYLIQDGKHFRDCRTNRSTLIDYLKEIQKKG